MYYGKSIKLLHLAMYINIDTHTHTHIRNWHVRHQPSIVYVTWWAMCHGAITLSPKDRSDGVCSAAVYKPRTLPPLIRCGTFILTVTFSPTQSCDALVTYGPPAYPTRWGTWRDIGVGSGLALISLVTGPLPSPQKTGLMGCAAPQFISPGPSHLSFDVRLLS